MKGRVQRKERQNIKKGKEGYRGRKGKSIEEGKVEYKERKGRVQRKER